MSAENIVESPAVLLDELRLNGRAHFTLPFRHALADRLQDAIAADFERLRAIDAAEIVRLRGEVGFTRDDVIAACARAGIFEPTIERIDAELSDIAPAMPNGVEGLEDLVTHREAWRNALVFAKGRMAGTDDESYWQHEITAFDRTFAALRAADNLDAAGVDSECRAHECRRVRTEMQAEIDRLRVIASCAYQLAGYHDAPEVWLDRLSEAASGLPLPPADTIIDELLPYAPDEATPTAAPAGEAVAPFIWFATDDDGRYGIGADRETAIGDLGGLPEALSRVFPLYTTPPAPVQAAPQEGEAEALARKFHDTYERLAPSFGYETRQETRQFDSETPNGRLMIAVCAELAARPSACELVVDEAMVKRAREAIRDFWEKYDGNCDGGEWDRAMMAGLTAALQHRGDSRGGEAKS